MGLVRPAVHFHRLDDLIRFDGRYRIPLVIKKSIDKAKRNLIFVPLKNGTVPHDVIGKYKSSEVLVKPACSGTGIIAGGTVRAIMEVAGATDIQSKSLGSNASVNVVRATFDAISKLMDAKKIAANRGKTLDELWG